MKGMTMIKSRVYTTIDVAFPLLQVNIVIVST